jgi:hypothetical protein
VIRWHVDTVWAYSIVMDSPIHGLADAQWVAQCAERLRQRWPRADRTSLEEAASELGRDPALRALPAPRAAERWLGLLDRPP